MIKVTVPVPAAGFSALLDAGVVQPQTSIGKLSKTLGPMDQFIVYGTLDAAATATSVNLTRLCNVQGNLGEVELSRELRGWRYYFVERLDGGGVGLFDVSGNTNKCVISPASVAIPATGAPFALLPLTSFKGPVRIALDGNQTAADVVNVYGTDDPTATGRAGATFIGQISGGGSDTDPNFGSGVGNAGWIDVASFENVLVERAAGGTPGLVLGSTRGHGIFRVATAADERACGWPRRRRSATRRPGAGTCSDA
jgi:hypothetical protein